MPKVLRMHTLRCGGGEGGSEEGGEVGGRSKAEMCCVWTVGQATSISEVYLILYSPRGMPKALGMHTLKYGGSEEGSEEGQIQVLQSWLLPRVDCGMKYRHQQSACSIYVMHIYRTVAPRVSQVSLGKFFEL